MSVGTHLAQHCDWGARGGCKTSFKFRGGLKGPSTARRGTARMRQGGRPCSSDAWKLSPFIFQHAMFRRPARAASTRNAPRGSLRRARAIARPAHAETDALRANSMMNHPRSTIVDEPAVAVDRRRRRSAVVAVVDRRRRRSVLVADKTPTETARFWNPRDRRYESWPRDPVNPAWIPTWILLRAHSA